MNALHLGNILWSLIANRIDPKYHATAQSLLSQFVDKLSTEEIDLVSSRQKISMLMIQSLQHLAVVVVGAEWWSRVGDQERQWLEL